MARGQDESASLSVLLSPRLCGVRRQLCKLHPTSEWSTASKAGIESMYERRKDERDRSPCFIQRLQYTQIEIHRSLGFLTIRLSSAVSTPGQRSKRTACFLTSLSVHWRDGLENAAALIYYVVYIGELRSSTCCTTLTYVRNAFYYGLIIFSQ